jgi:hypothetical protein
MGRTWAIAIAVLIVGDMLSARAQEQGDQWCAYSSNGPVNCGFATLEDCIKAIQGKTALCDHPSSTSGRRPRPHH